MRAWVGVVLCAGCFPASSGGPPGSSSSGDSTTSSATATDAGTTLASTGDPTSGADSSTLGLSSGQTTGPIGPPCDCADVLAQMPGAPDGIYELTISEGSDAGTTFMAYCDNTIDGGGWTLVARSAPFVAAPPFGWGQETGAVDDDGAPYSLDAASKQLRFNEVLFGDYARGKQWGGNAYKKLLPDDFLALYAAAPLSTPTDMVLGGCRPPLGPTGLQHIGFTNLGLIFAFAATEGDIEHGLGPREWDTIIDDCAEGGNLNGLPGMIFVR